MNKCARECIMQRSACNQTECRMWIRYREDLNCALVAVYNNKGPMTLEEISKRFGLSVVRIKQIQDKAIQKLKKNNPLLK